MANPYYPPFYYQTPYLVPFYQQPQVSPFIPSILLQSSPNLAPRRVHFEDDPVPPVRSRPPSWHAGIAPAPNPVPFPSPPVMYTALPPMYPLAPPANYVHQRRRSDSCLPQPAWVVPAYPSFVSPVVYQNPLPTNQWHPLLNGESPEGPLVLFDISLHTFSPQRITSRGDRSGVTLSMDVLSQQATHPGVKRMTITCDMTPQWPVELRANEHERFNYLSISATSDLRPISVGDVLFAIHSSYQRQVTHSDWMRLSQSEEMEIARAYTRRCKTFPSVEAFEKSQGVRRVDYLRENYMFGGLKRTAGHEGFENVKLVVGPKR
ncbi:hypothetical protein AcW1_004780 [Taiwanofungus camphoratus]|nr:hypothetical protein AcW1_004780 [Antrodia cinnamomea]